MKLTFLEYACPQLSQILEQRWIDPDLKSEVGISKLISPLKTTTTNTAGRELFLKPSPEILACKEQATNIHMTSNDRSGVFH